MPTSQHPLRLAMVQMNAHVGDLKGNAEKIRSGIADARAQGAEVVLFPELALTGYPPEDLLLREHFLIECRRQLLDIAKEEAHDIVAMVGFPERMEDVYNSLAVLSGGAVQAIYRKNHLPNYGVFDELRYFQNGDRGAVIELGHVRIGLTICEDIWTPGPPLSDEALAGASLIVNLSASPYHAAKAVGRERMLIQRARDNLVAVAYCNLVGGQDELVFEGHSLVIDHEGTIIARAPQFEEAVVTVNVDVAAPITARLRDTRMRPPVRRYLPEVRQLGRIAREGEPKVHTLGGTVAPLLDEHAEVYAALVMGTRDYANKNGFDHVTLGLSGGIDSTLVALIAVDALGSDRVTSVVMPSPYSSNETQGDARQLAANLGIDCIDLPIAPVMTAYDEVLSEVFADHAVDLTEENLQARIRGNLLMALSNKFGWLVLTTGNKSEASVGYSTLYGDTAGGFAVIKDVPKTLVYRLVEYRQERGDGDGLVPPSIISRAPSAELRANQKDSDSLPDYATLDAVLEAYIEDDASRERLELSGLPADAVDRALALVDRNEYKRRQQPPGIKITPRAFGRDRRMPITNAYRE